MRMIGWIIHEAKKYRFLLVLYLLAFVGLTALYRAAIISSYLLLLWSELVLVAWLFGLMYYVLVMARR